MADQLEIRSDFASKTGKRAANEDYVAIYDGTAQQRVRQGIVHAIADGMGGALGGRQAAESTVRDFIDAYYSLPDTLSIERSAGQALVAINRWIHSQVLLLITGPCVLLWTSAVPAADYPASGV